LPKREAQAIERITMAIKGHRRADPAAVPDRHPLHRDAEGEMVSGQNNKVIYMPYEATGVLGSLGGNSGDAWRPARSR